MYSRSPRIGTIAISRDDLDFGMSMKPSFHRGRFTIRQQIDHPPLLKIADQRAVALTAPPRPIVNADDARGTACLMGRLANTPQECVLAHRQLQALCKRLSRTAAKRQTKMPDQALKPGCASPMRLCAGRRNALREDLGSATDCHEKLTTETMAVVSGSS